MYHGVPLCLAFRSDGIHHRASCAMTACHVCTALSLANHLPDVASQSATSALVTTSRRRSSLRAVRRLRRPFGRPRKRHATEAWASMEIARPRGPWSARHRPGPWRSSPAGLASSARCRRPRSRPRSVRAKEGRRVLLPSWRSSPTHRRHPAQRQCVEHMWPPPRLTVPVRAAHRDGDHVASAAVSRQGRAYIVAA